MAWKGRRGTAATRKGYARPYCGTRDPFMEIGMFANPFPAGPSGALGHPVRAERPPTEGRRAPVSPSPAMGGAAGLSLMNEAAGSSIVDGAAASPAMGGTVLSLTMGGAASRAFAALTASPWRTADGDESTPDQAPGLWLSRGAAALKRADPRLVRSLRRAASDARPVLVVRGLPTDAVPPATPRDGIVDAAASRQAIVNLHAVAYVGESASTLHAVCPVASARGQRGSRGFDTALPFHTDYADRPIDEPVAGQSPAAAALAFAVERAEPSVPMECVALDRVLPALSPEDIRVGLSEEFAVAAPDIFGDGSAARTRRLFLPDAEGGIRCRLNLGKTTGLTPRASRLLRRIESLLSNEALVEKIHVRRGDIVILDNQRAVHRRASFAPRWDGTDRYLIRMSAVHDPLAGVAADSRRPWIWS